MRFNPNDIFGYNYTGPYISDGEFQTSVEFGSKEPKDALDASSRLHDTAYAHWDDRLHRTVADIIYYDQTRDLPGAFPAVARNAVLYGNFVKDSFYGLPGFSVEPSSVYKLAAKTYSDAEFLLQLIDKQDDLRHEILDYYKNDPFPQHQRLVGGVNKDMNFLAPFLFPKAFEKPNLRTSESVDSNSVNATPTPVSTSTNEYKNLP